MGRKIEQLAGENGCEESDWVKKMVKKRCWAAKWLLAWVTEMVAQNG